MDTDQAYWDDLRAEEQMDRLREEQHEREAHFGQPEPDPPLGRCCSCGAVIEEGETCLCHEPPDDEFRPRSR